uniref:Uncharacterized protein n=1 Tax=Arundo donax TaxID=35708 RepID=A0A0A8ZLC3_ARUDO
MSTVGMPPQWDDGDDSAAAVSWCTGVVEGTTMVSL